MDGRTVSINKFIIKAGLKYGVIINCIYNTFFWMSEEVSHDEHRCLSESSEADSEDSMEFQELKVGDKD